MAILIREPARPEAAAGVRPTVRGKFLWHGDQKLYLRGVTYGTFAPNADGEPFPDPRQVEEDFAAMARAGVNAVRTYTPAPDWMLDEAHRQGLFVLCGLPWEQHIAFLDERSRPRDIERRVREAVRSIAGHPALLGFTVGNEIPGDIVRWYGRRRIQRFLARLVRAVRDEDPGALVTYVNYPTTEYLELPFVDFFCFNVYLEERERLEAYLARLQNLAEDKPLVMAEVGLDSRRNGIDRQAEVLSWQVEATFGAGAAGCFVFAWTDEWHRGGAEIDDWDFGLVDRERRPKPALYAVQDAYRNRNVPFGEELAWPRMTVAICSYNGSRTLSDALDGVMELDYPNFEVIVVNDGSTDATPKIAAGYPVRVISTENQGLSAARNAAWQNATGEIVAYLDDDARPDRDWLRYLAQTILRHDAAGAGGPNLPPPGDGLVADCVAHAPGGPNHVLLDDVVAEHIPGCNMAFRRSVLEEVGGFDPRFRAAGDDVDICWRVQDAGYDIVFSPAAMVWHHRRNEIRTYWKQQVGYGKAEALLEAKWPERYNQVGHVSWAGRIYGAGRLVPLSSSRPRIYHGQWGLAPFQRLYSPTHDWLATFAVPELLLLAPGLAVLGALGYSWTPMFTAWLLLAIGATAYVWQAVLGARHARYAESGYAQPFMIRRGVLTTGLHVVQPVARLLGRIRHGLSPWRQSSGTAWAWPRVRLHQIWSETWVSPTTMLAGIEGRLLAGGCGVTRGGDFNAWDLQIRGGLNGAAEMVLMIESHGSGRQNARVRIRPVPSPAAVVVSCALSTLAIGAALSSAPVAAIALVIAALTIVGWSLAAAGAAEGAVMTVLSELKD